VTDQGESVSSAGMSTAMHFDDLIIGAGFADPNGISKAGKVMWWRNSGPLVWPQPVQSGRQQRLCGLTASADV